MAQSWPLCVSGTPFGTPVEPDVYRISASASSSGTKVSSAPKSRKASNPSAPPLSKSIVGTVSGTNGRRAASLSASSMPLSRKMCAMVARGSLWLTGTATAPMRMMPK